MVSLSFPHFANVPSPDSVPPIRLTDSQVGFSYVEFPADTFFMESLARNEVFDAETAYVPVERFANGREETHLYKMMSTSTVAEHVAGPILTPGDQSMDLTVFGSALSDTGVLYLALWNRNSILVCDLNDMPTVASTWTCQDEIKSIPAPNDVAVAEDGTLFVAGGRFVSILGGFGKFSNSAVGRVYRVDATSQKVDVIARQLNVLSGIEVVLGSSKENVQVAQLFDMVTLDGTVAPDPTWKVWLTDAVHFMFDLLGISKVLDSGVSVIWSGTKGEDVWLADNIDVFDAETLVCPAFDTASRLEVKAALQRNVLSSIGLFFLQLWTAIVEGEFDLLSEIRDPEVLLSFSNTFIDGSPDEPVRLIFWNAENKNDFVHFEIDLVQTRQDNPPRDIFDRDGELLGQRQFFNEQVTHVARLGDKLACVNFEQPRVLLFDVDFFTNSLN